MVRSIGKKNRNLVKRLTIEELNKACFKAHPSISLGREVERRVIDRLPVEMWDTWEGADNEIRTLIHDTLLYSPYTPEGVHY